MEEQKQNWKKTAEEMKQFTEDYFEAPIEKVFETFQLKHNTMEEQIKAMIEKYEKYQRNAMGCLTIDVENGDNTHGSIMQIGLTQSIISDLKQLLTTSQGNPDMV